MVSPNRAADAKGERERERERERDADKAPGGKKAMGRGGGFKH